MGRQDILSRLVVCGLLGWLSGMGLLRRLGGCIRWAGWLGCVGLVGWVDRVGSVVVGLVGLVGFVGLVGWVGFCLSGCLG